MAVDRATALANVAYAQTLGLPDIDRLPEWEKYKGGEPLAIVASGPSLRYTLAELAGFRAIMVAGSAHDFVVSRGVKPTYTVVLDPTPDLVLGYLQKPQPTCNYLVASQCDRGVFAHLRQYPVTLWHCDGTMNGETFLGDSVPPERSRLGGGGCTVGLRCVDIANRMGYYELHLFGFDSCIDQNTEQSHAFPFVDPKKEFSQGNGLEVVDIKIGKTEGEGRTFRVPKYLLAQCWDFEKMLKVSAGAANFTIHGDGVFSEMLRLYRAAHRR